MNFVQPCAARNRWREAIMKMPKVPPLFQELLHEATSTNRIQEIIGTFRDPLIRGKYLHWDKLIRYPLPEGFSHREWWLGTKISRMPFQKAIPLIDMHKEPFRYVLTDPIPERLHHIDLGAGGLIQMPDQITNPTTRDQYYVSSLIEEAITSSQLEGATTTRPVAKEMIRVGRAPRDRSERMILNNFLTMQRISTLKNEPLTKALVFEVHRMVTDQTLNDASSAGRFRRVDEPIIVGDEYGEVLHQPPRADELEERMAAMCNFANAEILREFVHPAIRSILLHFWLAYDHPFVDGNGRTARALFYWSMLRHGFWLFEFISISRIILSGPARYGRAFLYTETDQNDLTYFIIYHLDVIRRAVDELHLYIQRKVRQLQTLERRLRGVESLNHRQQALVSHALRHPQQRYTYESHQRSHNVAYQTSRTDLLNLMQRGLLQSRKIGKTWYFVPTTDLEQKLTQMD
jgi:Fic family protein